MMPEKQTVNKSWIRYAGMASQLIIALLLTVYFGKWLDTKLAFQKPVLIWVLPLLILIGSLIKLIKDTSVKK
jgi:F0F1-type ATP synthase assembly protein I